MRVNEKKGRGVLFHSLTAIRGEYFKCRYTCSIHSIFFNCFAYALTRTPHSLNTFCGITRLSLIEAHASLLNCLKPTTYTLGQLIGPFGLVVGLSVLYEGGNYMTGVRRCLYRSDMS